MWIIKLRLSHDYLAGCEKIATETLEGKYQQAERINMVNIMHEQLKKGKDQMLGWDNCIESAIHTVIILTDDLEYTLTRQCRFQDAFVERYHEAYIDHVELEDDKLIPIYGVHISVRPETSLPKLPTIPYHIISQMVNRR